MNKVVLLLLLPVLIFNTSVREVVKAPQLVLHFLQHHQQNAEISFIDFLEMHYLGQDPNDNDDDEDMKLPFKKIDGHHIISVGVPAEKFIMLKVICLNIYTKKTFDYANSYSSPDFGSLFRPPISLA